MLLAFSEITISMARVSADALAAHTSLEGESIQRPTAMKHCMAFRRRLARARDRPRALRQCVILRLFW